jgi:hypothetical protein
MQIDAQFVARTWRAMSFELESFAGSRHDAGVLRRLQRH